jgi:nitrate reductase (NAD(P)H)
MSMLFDSMIPDSDTIEVKGPIGSFEYLKNGLVSYKDKETCIDRFCMVAGGSGITPIHQVLHAILSNPGDKTKCTLLFANRTVDDILCGEQLDQWKDDCKFEVHHAIAVPPNGWKGISGYLCKESLEKYFPPPTEKMMLLICGPPALNKVIRDGATLIGWGPDQIVEF